VNEVEGTRPSAATAAVGRIAVLRSPGLLPRVPWHSPPPSVPKCQRADGLADWAAAQSESTLGQGQEASVSEAVRTSPSLHCPRARATPFSVRGREAVGDRSAPLKGRGFLSAPLTARCRERRAASGHLDAAVDGGGARVSHA